MPVPRLVPWFALITGCSGVVAGGGQRAATTVPGTPPALAALTGCQGPAPGPAPVRRLTRREYNNTVRDLLGDTRGLADRFVPEQQALGFDNDADLLGVSTVLAEQQMSAAEDLAARAVRD